MSCWLLFDPKDEYFRHWIYFTYYNNFVIIAREQQKTNVDYELQDHTVIHKKFVPVLAGLCKTTVDSGYSVNNEVPTAKEIKLSKLSHSLKRLFYDEDCNALPLWENQQAYFQSLEEIAKIWDIPFSPESPMKRTEDLFQDEETQMETPILKRSLGYCGSSRPVSPFDLFDNDETPTNQEKCEANLCLAPSKRSKTEF